MKRKDLIPAALVSLVALAGLVILFNSTDNSGAFTFELKSFDQQSYGEDYFIPSTDWQYGPEYAEMAARTCGPTNREWTQCCLDECRILAYEYNDIVNSCARVCERPEMFYAYRLGEVR